MLNPGVMNPKVGPLRLFWGTFEATTSGSHTPVHGLVRSILPLQHEICVLQATTGCCRNLATKLRVGPLCSTLQLSPLSGWPRRSTNEATMQVDLGTPWQLTLQPVWALASWIVKPFKHLLRATADPQFWRLSCECPWVLAQDNTVNDFMWLLRSLNERQPHKLHNKTLHIYMHCYSMYGLCLIRGDNDCVAIAWKL